MSSSALRRLFRANVNMALLGGNASVNHLAARVTPKDFESSRISDLSRFEDEAPPTEDDMISKLVLVE